MDLDVEVALLQAFELLGVECDPARDCPAGALGHDEVADRGTACALGDSLVDAGHRGGRGQPLERAVDRELAAGEGGGRRPPAGYVRAVVARDRYPPQTGGKFI